MDFLKHDTVEIGYFPWLSGITVSKETILTVTFNTIIQNENIASNGQGPLLQTWINFNPSMDKY